METTLFLFSVTLLITGSTVLASWDLIPSYDVTSVSEDRFLLLLGRVENLEKRDEEQRAEIDTLRLELNSEKQRVSKLETTLALFKLTTGKQGDGETVANEPTTGTDLPDTTVTSQHANNGTVRETLSDKNQGRPRPMIRRQLDVPVVAFHATLSSVTEHLGIKQAVVFDKVITNIGAAYNPHVGSFVAPVPGVYVFSTTITGYSHHVFHASIVHNGNRVAYLYIRGVESAYGNDSGMVVLHLNKGDDVLVHINESDKAVDGSDNSMFSGFLLSEDSHSQNIIGKK